MTSQEDKVLSLLGITGQQIDGTNKATALAGLKKILSEATVAVLPGLRARHALELLGTTPEEAILVDQWLSFTRTSTIAVEDLKALSQILSKQSYLVGHRPTLADVDVFVAITPIVVPNMVEQVPAFARWFDHMGRLLQQPAVFVFPAPVFPVPSIDEAEGAKETPKEAIKEVLPVPPVAAAVPVEEKKATEQPKKDKKPSAPAAAAPAAAEAKEELDPSKLDIRVGLVVKCWNHEGSEKLLCEEIDLGEGSTRQIASGIRAFYTAEQVTGRKVLVLANLKERSIAGFKSNGMVLCASNADHTAVQILDPPAAAAVGDKVSFDGFTSQPATASQMVKKKIFEGLAPGLRTDGDGVARWEDKAFKVGGELCRASLANASVS